MENKKTYANTLMAALFIAAVFVIAVKVMDPTPVQISVDGGKTVIEQISGVFTYFDTAILGISAFVVGVSVTYFAVKS